MGLRFPSGLTYRISARERERVSGFRASGFEGLGFHNVAEPEYHTCKLIPYPFLGYLCLYLADPNHRTWYPRKGVGYKPRGRAFDRGKPSNSMSHPDHTSTGAVQTKTEGLGFGVPYFNAFFLKEPL